MPRRSLGVLSMMLGACGSPHSPVPPVTASVQGPGCAGARLLAAPPDLSMPGPWPVGARTLVADGTTIEVWYPARPGGIGAAPRVRYDLRTAMPPGEAAKIPDAENAWLDCACERDLPVDTSHGPYPVVLFFHGAASFRAQSAFLATHWASRGFVVIAPDLPGVGLSAILSGETRLPLDVPIAMLDLVTRPSDADPLAFVRPQLGSNIAVVGHSLGSILAQTLVDRAEVTVRISMAGMASYDPRVSTLVLAGDRDGIASADDARAGFADAPAASRLAIIHGAGHLGFTDLCLIGADRGGALAIARAHGVAIPEMIATLATDGCRATDAPFAMTAPVIRAVTAGVLEERLRCDPAASAALTRLRTDPRLELVEHLGHSAPAP